MGVGGDLISRAAWMFARSNPETRSRRARYRRWSQNDSDVLASAIVADGMSTPKKLDHPFQLAVLGKVRPDDLSTDFRTGDGGEKIPHKYSIPLSLRSFLFGRFE